jgi:hypothetical protein
MLVKERISEAEFDRLAALNVRASADVRAALNAPEPDHTQEPTLLSLALLDEFRARLARGLEQEQLFEIVGQLVAGVTVTTVFDESGRRSVQFRIDYRFGPPREPTVRGATDCTGTRSAARP